MSKTKLFQKIKNEIFENGSYKIVALLITLILWITVLGNKDQILNQSVHLNFVLPQNSIIANAITDRVQVQISGSRLSLKKIGKGIEPIEVNIDDAKPGRTIVTIPTDKIILPFGAQIMSVTPSTLVIDIDRISMKRLPVKVSWDSDQEPKHIRVTNIKPSEVVLKGATSILARIGEVWTEPINPMEIIFDKYKKNVDVRVSLKDLNYYGILPFGNKNVNVTMAPK